MIQFDKYFSDGLKPPPSMYYAYYAMCFRVVYASYLSRRGTFEFTFYLSKTDFESNWVLCDATLD